jgi:UDP-N-acetylglucosamine:LPS N-acetylglucosamine transferase
MAAKFLPARVLKKNMTLNICFAASSGGHLTQLLYAVGWGNRQHPALMIVMVYRCLRIWVRERPNVVISTGAAVGCVMALIVKLTGGKVIWIDTISHVSHLTLSGRIIRPFADIFLVQWPELTERYKGVAYEGAVI